MAGRITKNELHQNLKNEIESKASQLDLEGLAENQEEFTSHLAQIAEDVAEVPTIIDESLGGAKIRDNNGVLETLVGSVWIPILKEGDVMPILPNMIQAGRQTATSAESDFVTMIDIIGKKGILKNITGGDDNFSTFKITIDGQLLNFKWGSFNFTEIGSNTLSRTFSTIHHRDTSHGAELNLQFKESCKVESKYIGTTSQRVTITVLTE